MKYELGTRKMIRIFLISLSVLFLAVSCNQKIEIPQEVTPNEISQPQEQVQERKLDIVKTVWQAVSGSGKATEMLELKSGQTALDLLKASHTIETKTFSGIGEYVTTIDGKKEDSKHFWALYVNGKQSQVGASDYKVKAGDKIEWKFEEIK